MTLVVVRVPGPDPVALVLVGADAEAWPPRELRVRGVLRSVLLLDVCFLDDVVCAGVKQAWAWCDHGPG